MQYKAARVRCPRAVLGVRWADSQPKDNDVMRQIWKFLFFKVEDVVNAYLMHKLRHVWDEYHRTLILVECFCYRREMAEIDVIGRLIENE